MLPVQIVGGGDGLVPVYRQRSRTCAPSRSPTSTNVASSVGYSSAPGQPFRVRLDLYQVVARAVDVEFVRHQSATLTRHG
jgi:hypothetical protein